VEDTDEYDEFGIVKFKRVRFNQYMFVRLAGPANSTDYTIIPFALKHDFKLGLTRG